MTITLADYFKNAKGPEHKAFIADLLRFSDLIGVVPFETTSALQISATRWQTVPATAFRAINAGYTESTGNVEQIEETLFALGGDVKVDRLLTIAGNVYQDPLATQMQMKAKSVAFSFNDYFINGDHGVDPDGFEGLKKRVSNMPSRMSINLASSNDSLKVLASTANTHTFLDAMHQAIKYVDGATHILCNEDTLLKIEAALRRTNPILLDQAKDAFDRKISTFMGVPLVDVGLKRDKSTEIITSTENPGDGGNDATSIYVVRMDTDDGLHGLQLSGTSPEPYDPLTGGELEATPQHLRRIDWAVGLCNVSQYCIARIYGFRMAAS